MSELIERISIHSPRMGRDASPAPWRNSGPDFNPLSPHGERLVGEIRAVGILKNFNPLSPHGERLSGSGLRFPVSYISIHSPRMGRDQNNHRYYNTKTISIHSPRMGRDPF